MKSYKSLKPFCVVGELMFGAEVAGIVGGGVWAFCGVALPYGGCYGEFGKLLVRVCGGWVGVCVFSKRNPLILHKPCGELLRKNSTMRVITS